MAPDVSFLSLGAAGKGRLRFSGPLMLGAVVFCACLFGIYTRPVGFLATLWPANAVMLGFMLLRPETARPLGWFAASAA